MILARIGRVSRFDVARWLVYPVLAAGLVKLIVQDLREGRPATIMFSLLVYGAALIVAPRMARPGP